MDESTNAKKTWTSDTRVRVESDDLSGMTCSRARDMADRRADLGYMALTFLGAHMADEGRFHENGCPAHDAALVEEIENLAGERLHLHAVSRGWI